MEPPAAETKSSFVSRFLKKTTLGFLSELFSCVGLSPEQKKAEKDWKQDPAGEIPSRSNETTVFSNDIETTYNSFKQFDIVQDFSDHYFRKYKPQKPTNNWVKSVEKEWKILDKNLPETIYVRIYEDRMDIMRAAIVGSSGTPYHDGLFFFDIYFPPSYPSKPPELHYWSRGLRLNPNLYACGKVCISLINTWSGSGCEKWIPNKSSMLQVLVSIQALVLNARPFFNEPEFDAHANTSYGEKQSLRYNSKAFISSGKTMLFSLRSPPKHFEDFVAGHFRNHGKTILVACSAYISGTPVGSVNEEGRQDLTCEVGKNNEFKASMKGLLKELSKEFAAHGVDCAEFLQTEDGEAGSSRTAPK